MALVHPAPIRATSRLVLAMMALHALDPGVARRAGSPEAATYFGGHGLLSTVLDPWGVLTPESQQRLVRKAIHDLVVHDCVKPLGTTPHTRTRRYLLTL
jgi:hypothetical protein